MITKSQILDVQNKWGNGIVKIGVKAASGSTLTETTKQDIVNKNKVDCFV